MSFSHSFSDSFYMADGDDSLAGDLEWYPYTVYQAIVDMNESDWADMCHDVFNMDHTMVDVGMVMNKIRETNTVTNLSSPVEVWIDKAGFHSVYVHECTQEALKLRQLCNR